MLLSDGARYEMFKHGAPFSYMYRRCRGQLSGNRCVFFEKLYGFNFLSRRTSRTLIWDSPSSCVNHVSSMALVAHLQLWLLHWLMSVQFVCTYTDKCHSASSCLRGTLQQSLKQISVWSVTSCASVPAWLLEAPRILVVCIPSSFSHN